MGRREDIFSESKRLFAESLPDIAVNITAAILIWLFGTLIFLPLSKGQVFLETVSMAKVVAGALIVALALIFLRVFTEIRGMVNALSGLATVYISGNGSNEEDIVRYQEALSGVAYVLVSVVAYMFFVPFLEAIAPVLSGIVLLLIVIWGIIVLFKAGEAFSDRIEARANKIAGRIKDSLDDEESQ